MAVLGVFLLIVTLAILVVIPKTRRVMKSHRAATLTLCFVYLAGLFVHPYLLGLKGRIDEIRFARHLRNGLSRDQVLSLGAKYGATAPGGSDVSSGGEAAYDPSSDGAVNLQFVDFVTLCVSGGKNYAVYFSPALRVTEWKVEPWGNAC
jgi:hypothetical protein